MAVAMLALCRNHQDVALAQEVEHGSEFVSTGRGSAAALLRSNDLAARRLECDLLYLEVLVNGAYSTAFSTSATPCSNLLQYFGILT